MAITWTDVVNIAPHLSTVPPASQAAILQSAYILLNADTWGNKFDEGWKYLAAHIGTLYQLQATGAPGIPSKERVGEVERSYAVPAGMGVGDLDQTWYGNHYKRLVRSLINARMPLVV